MSTAIITGASSGLGREYARALLAQHPEIDTYWLIARRADRLKTLADELTGKSVTVLPLDLTHRESFNTLRDLLAEKQPDVQYLINNSGYGKLGDFIEMPMEDTAGMAELNCVALTAMTSLVLPYMHKGASVIMVSSIAAFVPTPRMAVYCSTKAYVLSLAKALRFELKDRGIHVLAACPGPMDTEFLDVANITGHSKMFAQLPRVSPKRMAEQSIKKADAGRNVYTQRALFKLYRVLGKLLPHALLEPFVKC